MRTLRDVMREKATAEAAQSARLDAIEAKAREIHAAYWDGKPGYGYDNSIRELVKLGYAEHQADDILHPLPRKG